MSSFLLTASSLGLSSRPEEGKRVLGIYPLGRATTTASGNMLPRQQHPFYPLPLTQIQPASSASDRQRSASSSSALRSRTPLAYTPPTGRRIADVEQQQHPPSHHRNSFVCLPTYRRYRLGETRVEAVPTSRELCHIAQLEEEVNRLRCQHQTLLSTVQSLSLCDVPVAPPQLSPLKPLPASVWVER